MNKKDALLPDFIQLRIEGLSFQAIADKLNVAKQTLLEWNKQLTTKQAIEQGRTFRINELLKAYEMDREQRLKGLLQFRKKMKDELLSRPLEDVSTHKLHEMFLSTTESIQKVLRMKIEVGSNPSIVSFDTGDGFFYFSEDE